MNEHERLVHDTLSRSGYEVLRRGWPDFLVIHPRGSVFALEWKQLGTRDSVSPAQERMHNVLGIAGVPTLTTGSLTDVLGYFPADQREVKTAAFAKHRRFLMAQIDELHDQIARGSD